MSVVLTKFCRVCEETKTLEEFVKHPDGKYGRGTICRECNKIKASEYAAKNADALREKRAKYNEENRELVNAKMRAARAADPEKFREAGRLRYAENREELVAEMRSRYQENKEVFKEKVREYRLKNPEKVKACSRRWREENKDSYNKKTSEYQKKKRKEDLNYRLRCNLRTRLGEAIKANQKSGSAVSDLGCTIEELKAYLESLFQPGMTWENWGLHGWHIDHKIPLAAFDLTDREQLLKACHYTNLQPLWAEENLSKGATLIQESV